MKFKDIFFRADYFLLFYTHLHKNYRSLSHRPAHISNQHNIVCRTHYTYELFACVFFTAFVVPSSSSSTTTSLILVRPVLSWLYRANGHILRETEGKRWGDKSTRRSIFLLLFHSEELLVFFFQSTHKGVNFSTKQAANVTYAIWQMGENNKSITSSLGCSGSAELDRIFSPGYTDNWHFKAVFISHLFTCKECGVI